MTIFGDSPLYRVAVKIAAVIKRNAKIKFTDAIIATTALYTDTLLITKNIKNFKN